MGVLHLAIANQRMEMIDLIMMSCEHADINLLSPSAGTPLHVACKTGNLKIVQKLILSGADILIKHPATGLVARETTNNQRIIFLLEKYEKHQLIHEKKKNHVHMDIATNKSE